MSTLTSPVLRPLRLIEIFDRALRLYRGNFIQYVGILAIAQVPLAILQLIVSLVTQSDVATAISNPFLAPEDIFTPTFLLGIGINLILQLISFVLVQGIAIATLTRAMAGHYLGEKTVSILDAYRLVQPIWLPVIATTFILTLIGILSGLWWIVPCIGWLTGGGIVFFISNLVTPLAMPAVVLEKQAPLTAWRRAWDLVRTRFWWMLGFAIVLALFSLFTINGPAALINLVAQFTLTDALNPSASDLAIQTALQSIATLVATLLFVPIQTACFTILYFDQRVRSEGLDLLIQSETDKGLFQLLEDSAPPLQQELVTSQELGYFALLSVGILALAFLLYVVFAALGLAFISALTTLG